MLSRNTSLINLMRGYMVVSETTAQKTERKKMSDVYLGEDHYKNIAVTEINEAINFCMTNNLSKDKIKKIEKALDYLCSGVLYDSEILENEHSI